MLIGRRVTIGPLVSDDFGSLFCWANDVAAARLDCAWRPVDLVAHRNWCEGLANDPSKVVFGIRKTNETAIIGYVQIMNISPVHRSADLGVRIGSESQRGQGLGKEAVALALEYCWNHLNLNRVQLIVFKHNQRAIRAYRANGFTREGLLRRALFVGGEWTDVLVMACLRPRRNRKASVKLSPRASPVAASPAPS